MAGAVAAQETPQPPAKAPQAPKAKVAPATPAPAPHAAPRVYVTPRSLESGDGQATPLTMKVVRNARIAVSSRSVNVHIIGIDGETLEATASNNEGPFPVKAQTSGDEASPKILIYVPLTMGRRNDSEINLQIKLPRYAAVESVESVAGNIEINGIDAPVAVNTTNGQISIARVASLKASTRHGEITAREIKGDAVARSMNGDLTFEDIGGAIDAAATNGSLNVRNAAGDLRLCDAAGPDSPAVVPVPEVSDRSPVAFLTNGRAAWDCSGRTVDGYTSTLWLAVGSRVDRVEQRYVVDGEPGPWFGTTARNGYAHLQTWLTGPVTGAATLGVQQRVLDADGAPVAQDALPTNRQPLPGCRDGDVQIG